MRRLNSILPPAASLLPYYLIFYVIAQKTKRNVPYFKYILGLNNELRDHSTSLKKNIKILKPCVTK